jgi:hypothetical protein
MTIVYTPVPSPTLTAPEYLLLEQGGFLLTEDGDKILINNPGDYDKIAAPVGTIYTPINSPT